MKRISAIIFSLIIALFAFMPVFAETDDAEKFTLEARNMQSQAVMFNKDTTDKTVYRGLVSSTQSSIKILNDNLDGFLNDDDFFNQSASVLPCLEISKSLFSELKENIGDIDLYANMSDIINDLDMVIQKINQKRGSVISASKKSVKNEETDTTTVTIVIIVAAAVVIALGTIAFLLYKKNSKK